METDDSPVARPKRKYEDDLVLDLFNNVSLSPLKKLRQDVGLPTIFEEYPYISTPANHRDRLDIATVSVTNLPEELPESAPVHTSDEKAIVLYRPVNPPLFPGGPSTGSADLPLKLNTRVFTKGMLDDSNLLRASRSDDQFQLLGAQEKNSLANGDLSESEEGMESDGNPNNRLAVIPWVQNTIQFTPADVKQLATSGTGSQVFSKIDDQMSVDNAMGAEAMEEDTAIVDHSQQGNPVLSFGSEPWQHYGVPQPPYSSAMRSH